MSVAAIIYRMWIDRDSSEISQQSIARKNSSDGKFEYIMASMLIVLLDVW